MVTGSNMEANKPLLPSLNPSYKNRGNTGIAPCNITLGACTGNRTPRTPVLDLSNLVICDCPVKGGYIELWCVCILSIFNELECLAVAVFNLILSLLFVLNVNRLFETHLSAGFINYRDVNNKSYSM